MLGDVRNGDKAALGRQKLSAAIPQLLMWANLTGTTIAMMVAAPNGFHLSLRLRVTREARKGAWRPPSLFMLPG